MENIEELKPITWLELKKWVNAIPEDKLANIAHIICDDEGTGRKLLEPFYTEEDLYVYDGDYENCGSLEFLEESEGEDFEIDNCVLITPKGTPFLWTDG